MLQVPNLMEIKNLISIGMSMVVPKKILRVSRKDRRSGIVKKFIFVSLHVAGTKEKVKLRMQKSWL